MKYHAYFGIILMLTKMNYSQKIIRKCDGIITNCDSLAYYKVRWTVITNCDSFLLQSATRFITNCDSYYKVRWIYYKLRQVLQSTMIIPKLRQVLQSAMDLLQIATGIAKCDDYYKLRQVLQSAMIITNCDRYYKVR